MFKSILVPVDLGHREKLDKAISVAARLSETEGAAVTLCGVTAGSPSSVARTPEEFAQKLEAFAQAQSSARGVSFAARSVVSHDPSVELDDKLNEVAHDIGADLIVMASHVPGFLEHVISSNAGHLAAHTDISVMVVR